MKLPSLLMLLTLAGLAAAQDGELDIIEDRAKHIKTDANVILDSVDTLRGETPVEPPTEPPIDPDPPIEPPDPEPIPPGECELNKGRPPIKPPEGEPHVAPPKANSLPLVNYIDHWQGDERVLKAVKMNSWENIWANRSGNGNVGKEYFYSPQLNAMGVRWKPGVRSLTQYRITWLDALDCLEEDAKIITVITRANYPHGVSWGGKHFQLSPKGELLFEYKRGGLGDTAQRLMAPFWRTYKGKIILEPALGENIPGENMRWGKASASTSNKNAAPALHESGYRSSDKYDGLPWESVRRYHVGFAEETHPDWGTPAYNERRRTYFIRANNQWHTLVFTVDYTKAAEFDEEGELIPGTGHKFCFWVASQGSVEDQWPATPLTLYTGMPPEKATPERPVGDCYIIEHKNRYNPITSFWYEFNNSSNVASESGTMYFRDFMVVRDLYGDDVYNDAALAQFGRLGDNMPGEEAVQAPQDHECTRCE